MLITTRSIFIAGKCLQFPKMKKCLCKSVHIFIPVPVLPCSWPSLMEPCGVTPGWVCSVRCLETMLSPFLVLFPFSRCSNGTGRSLGNFPFCSSSSLLLPSGPFLFYFHSADVLRPPLPHWPEWISCGSAHPSLHRYRDRQQSNAKV